MMLSTSSMFGALKPIRDKFTARIVQNKPVAQGQWQMTLKSEDGAFPDFDLGNFCMLSLDGMSDPLIPRPFAIVQKDSEGQYVFIYRTHGKMTRALSAQPLGTKIQVLGPLGKGLLPAVASKRPVFIAGGVGYASLLPLVHEAVKAKADATLFYGVRSDIELIRQWPLTPLVSTDDGTSGFRGRLPDLIKTKMSLLEKADGIFICGSSGLMRALYDIVPLAKSYFFLEEPMGCGVGICVGCVVPVLEKNGNIHRVRSCIEGPIFNGKDLSEWRKLA